MFIECSVANNLIFRPTQVLDGILSDLLPTPKWRYLSPFGICSSIVLVRPFLWCSDTWYKWEHVLIPVCIGVVWNDSGLTFLSLILAHSFLSLLGCPVVLGKCVCSFTDLQCSRCLQLLHSLITRMTDYKYNGQGLLVEFLNPLLLIKRPGHCLLSRFSQYPCQLYQSRFSGTVHRCRLRKKVKFPPCCCW